jgi:xanthine dehydrogenase accessory factor
MKLQVLKEIIQKKSSNQKFVLLTNLTNGNSEIFEFGKLLSNDFKDYKKEIEEYYSLNKNGIIDGTQIFIQNHRRQIEVIIVGAVHIAQYVLDLFKNLDFVVTIIDPRKYFISEERFPNIKIINEWPEEVFKKLQTNSSNALITLTHDPKIDDPALKHALKNKFFYIGALGSKKTHAKRCQRLKEDGFSEEEIASIHGPIGIKLGGKSGPEIALSIVSQIVQESNKLLLNS